jgi:hypothetical protein
MHCRTDAFEYDTHDLYGVRKAFRLCERPLIDTGQVGSGALRQVAIVWVRCDKRRSSLELGWVIGVRR